MDIFSKATAEIVRFQRLSSRAKLLFFSSFFYEIASPIAFLFTNAFLFRSGETNALVALYNLGMFVALPVGFYLNGYLLRKVRFTTLFAIGVPMQGLAGLVLFFLPLLSPFSVFLFGCFFGFSIAIYWANRNFLTLDSTVDEERTYYAGLEQIMVIYVGIVVPFLMGLALASAPFLFHVDILFLYRAFALVALGVHSMNAVLLLQLETKNPSVQKVVLLRASRLWWKVRFLEILHGIENGIEIFVPTLIVLTFLGGVGTLGFLSALSAFIGSVAVYAVTSSIRPSQRPSRFLLFSLLKIAVSLIYAVVFSRETALLLIITAPSLLQLKFPLQQAQVLRTLDDEENGDDTNNYAYIADQELFLNFGRIIGVGIFFALGFLFTNVLTLRIMPLFSAFSQLGIAFILFNLAHHAYGKK